MNSTRMSHRGDRPWVYWNFRSKSFLFTLLSSPATTGLCSIPLLLSAFAVLAEDLYPSFIQGKESAPGFACRLNYFYILIWLLYSLFCSYCTSANPFNRRNLHFLSRQGTELGGWPEIYVLSWEHKRSFVAANRLTCFPSWEYEEG